jgi:hypothetical protein
MADNVTGVFPVGSVRFSPGSTAAGCFSSKTVGQSLFEYRPVEILAPSLVQRFEQLVLENAALQRDLAEAHERIAWLEASGKERPLRRGQV